jgi:hypothetical protein
MFMIGTTRKFTKGASLPYILVTYYLFFDLYTMLLKGPYFHDKYFTCLRLVLHMFDYFNYLT